MQWQIFPDRVAVKTEGSSTEIAWNKICRVIKTSHGFLIYPNEQAHFWIPLRAFTNTDDVAKLSRIAESEAKEFLNAK